ncbi:MAG: hypothetical protein IJU95_00525, partial [Treponema sp.]|nr:hypothetical protein [Treponema sp.]
MLNIWEKASWQADKKGFKSDTSILIQFTPVSYIFPQKNISFNGSLYAMEKNRVFFYNIAQMNQETSTMTDSNDEQ